MGPVAPRRVFLLICPFPVLWRAHAASHVLDRRLHVELLEEIAARDKHVGAGPGCENGGLRVDAAVDHHVEADCDIHHELRRIREMGLRNALVFNPETPFERLLPYLGEVDEVLAMTVHPGYGGQSFIADCLPKIAALRAARPDLDVMVGGGSNAETAVLAANAGANMFVAGSYLFRQADMRAAVADMRNRVKGTTVQ